MPKEPKIAGVRSTDKTLFTMILLNFEEGDQWNVYLGDYLEEVNKIVDSHELDTVIIPDLNPSGSYTFLVTLNNAPFPVAIISEHLDETPPHYLVEATGGSTLLQVNETINLPWADPINTTLTEVEGAAVEWHFSKPLNTFGKNRTL